MDPKLHECLSLYTFNIHLDDIPNILYIMYSGGCQFNAHLCMIILLLDIHQFVSSNAQSLKQQKNNKNVGIDLIPQYCFYFYLTRNVHRIWGMLEFSNSEEQLNSGS